MNLNESLRQAQLKLTEYDIDTREARLLLAVALNVRNEELIKYKEISDEENDKFQELINKRCQGIPYAYITGTKEFMKLNFKVNENVLIPREDTEVLVEKALKTIAESPKEKVKVLDMCTGSGCIAISIYKHSTKPVKIMAVDISKEALQVAKENAVLNDASISFICSDLFNEINEAERFDIIVSNPPYIQTNVIDTLQKEVKEHEPMMALDGGEDGLDFYKKITENAKKYLSEDGILIFEIGFDQAQTVSEVLLENGYKDIQVIKDYSGNDRVVVAKI